MSENEPLDILCAAARDYVDATENLREANEQLGVRMNRLALAKEAFLEAEAAMVEAKRQLLRAVVDHRVLE